MTEIKPSWMRWPPNCCETCINWTQDQNDRWIGDCNNDVIGIGDRTDARYRCPNFSRKPDPKPNEGIPTS